MLSLLVFFNLLAKSLIYLTVLFITLGEIFILGNGNKKKIHLIFTRINFKGINMEKGLK